MTTLDLHHNIPSKKNENPTPGFRTRAIHAGQDPDPLTGAVIPPIYQTSTFVQPGVETLRAGFEYSRGGNPTRTGLEEQLAKLEAGAAAFSFASGMAAEDALLRAVLKPGATVVSTAETYGGTHRLLTQLYARWGVNTVFVSPSEQDKLAQAVETYRPDVVWLETPSNPLLTVVDISAWAEATHQYGGLLVVDNTFASPALQQPITLGADLVIHSTTKYIGGHSDVLGGAIVVGETSWEDKPLAEVIGFQQFAAGAVAGPQDCFLTSRGLKTLGVRMQQHCENARIIAEWLQDRSEVDQVFYPGLSSHPSYDIARRQMSDFGGIVSFRLNGGEAKARQVAESTETFLLSVSLGGVESLISHPATMTHGSTKGSEQAPPADVVRLSVGIENIEDLLIDLERALRS
ncbi:cystathionine gamma-synthase [Auritidibacter ignavus]|uniref:cystathionine gamma-synthase n=1 Tax=Auritidibacter ignavus TaxID=678932 RepID=UPI0024B9B7F3|nr:cystathionine gamma-synthase [Auritidibacter ignavus]WHS28242.1 cystathionine gamma-synthase [Auritidibacter ignavus]